jgi:hypothetical protein
MAVSTTDPPSSAVKGRSDVIVECFALRLVDQSIVARRVRGPLIGSPDATAVGLVGLDQSSIDGVAVLHSTSWRWDDEVGLILTYLCCPDPRPGLDGEFVVPPPSHARADDNPSRPGRNRLDIGDVLHHGIDHFAWLAEHHPATVARAAAADLELWVTIRRAGHHRAGQLHVSAHHAHSMVTNADSADHVR